MEDDAYNVVPCFSPVVESINRSGLAGAIWGLCIGPYKATQQGLRGVGKASFVARSVGNYGIKCGAVVGVYSITRRAVQKYRGRDDGVNKFVGGVAIAADMNAAAMNAGARSGRQPFWVIGLLSVLCVFAVPSDAPN